MVDRDNTTRCNFRFYEVKNGAEEDAGPMETILGPIQRPFVSVTALFVLHQDVEYVTINPDSPINFLGENSAPWHDTNSRHLALASLPLFREKRKKKKKERKITKYFPSMLIFFSFSKNLYSRFCPSFRYLIWNFSVSSIYLFDDGYYKSPKIYIYIYRYWIRFFEGNKKKTN